jgi:hypothetical protein
VARLEEIVDAYDSTLKALASFLGDHIPADDRKAFEDVINPYLDVLDRLDPPGRERWPMRAQGEPS